MKSFFLYTGKNYNTSFDQNHTKNKDYTNNNLT